MSEIIIRAARPGDVAEIFAIVEALAAYEKLSHELVGTEEDLHKALFSQRPYAQVMVAEVDQKVVASAIYFYNFSTFLMKPGIYLEDLFVLPEYRRRGIATLLIKRLAQQAVEQGCGRLEWSVLDWNKSAITFYKNIGAVLMDEWTGCRVSGEALENLASGADKR